jgi:hypothetical protein
VARESWEANDFEPTLLEVHPKVGFILENAVGAFDRCVVFEVETWVQFGSIGSRMPWKTMAQHAEQT